jgi:hypothetical protein
VKRFHAKAAKIAKKSQNILAPFAFFARFA